MGKFQDLTGQRFGRLKVLKQGPNKTNKITWFCKCDCGNFKIVRAGDLKKGMSKSCGCLRKEVSNKRMTKHGLRYHPLYCVWQSMKERCSNPKNKAYKYYGPKGIKVCDLWKNNPEKFINWCLSHGWKPDLQIDRIDNDKGYSPDNCRFVTSQVNNCNQRFLKKSNTSGYRGVCFHRRDKIFEAYCSWKTKHYNIGRFNTAKQAAIARDKFVKVHNFDLPLNFPDCI